MSKITLVGTLQASDKLEIFGHSIAISPLSRRIVGQRLKTEGYICYSDKDGAYFQITKYSPTEKPDSNVCVIEGAVLGVLEPRKHPAHGTTGCIVLRQTKAMNSRVLVTVAGKYINEFDLGNLSTGERLRIRGYVNYHSKGLHVTYCGKEDLPNE